jgi:hypothetical protein
MTNDSLDADLAIRRLSEEAYAEWLIPTRVVADSNLIGSGSWASDSVPV